MEEPLIVTTDRGHPRFGWRGCDSIKVLRPTASPSVVRDVFFADIESAKNYILQLPEGAAYDARPFSGYSDFGLCALLESLGIPKHIPWSYWPTEAERAE